MKIKLPKNQNSTKQPTNYFMVVDVSGSMGNDISDLKQSLYELKNLVNEQDTVSIAYFSSYDEYNWIIKGVNIKNVDITNIINKNIYSRGLTCFNQVLKSLTTVVSDVNHLTGHNNNVLYFQSDGHPNDRSNEQEFIEILNTNKLLFQESYILGYNNYYNRKLLLDMTNIVGGKFYHVNGLDDVKKVNEISFKESTKFTNVNINKIYDLVWIVTNNDVKLLKQKEDNSVDVIDDGNENNLYAIDYSELENCLDFDSKFIYSLTSCLSQRNLANKGIELLILNGDFLNAKILQKAFSTTQKGNVENDLKKLALSSDRINKSSKPNTIKFSEFVKVLFNEKTYLNLKDCDYKNITKGNKGVSISKFVKDEGTNDLITDVIKNSNRPNISFQILRTGNIMSVNECLQNEIDEHNKQLTTDKKIEFPIKTVMYKNYALVSNGDFNFKKFSYIQNNISRLINPDTFIELFESDNRTYKFSEFCKLSKEYIVQKAEESVLNFLLKEEGEQKHKFDLRDIYGEKGKEILSKIGLDYQMRYSPKSEEEVSEDNSNRDYIPFLAFTTQIKGASTINSKTDWDKIQKGKSNISTEITKPFFEKYTSKKTLLKENEYVKFLKNAIENCKKQKDLLNESLSVIKFNMIMSNSWFNDVDKADEISWDVDGTILIVKIKEEKEYI